MTPDGSTVRVALANVPFPSSPAHSLELATGAILQAAGQGAQIVCFPEAFLPGYRGLGMIVAPPDASFLEESQRSLAASCKEVQIAAVVGTERITPAGLMISTIVFGPDGGLLGFQDKVQLDPSEEATYVAGSGRHLFQVGDLLFGVVMCHEGWRYPETVRSLARQGAQIVFHPHFDLAADGAFVPTEFADPRNSFHEKALLCRAAENTCFIASVNHAVERSSTTSAFVDPDGVVIAWQPYGRAGLLLADLDLRRATGLLAHRLRV